MKWLYKLEYRFGKYYIRRLMTIMIGGMIAVYLAQGLLNLNLYGLLSLNRAAVLSGQVWRLVTFLFIPPDSGILWTLIALYFYYIMGTSLENTWGGFRFNVYYLVGWLGAIASMFITGYASNGYLNMSLFLAYAILAPDTTFLLFFIIPLKAKWLALFYAVMMGAGLVNAFLVSPTAGISALVTLGFSLLNVLIFFGPTLVRGIKEQIRISQNRRNWRNKNR